MNTEDLIKANKARFNLNYQKLQLKEKYSAKLLFADQSGLWLAGPELFSTLQYFTEEQVILVDQYSNPVKVDRLRLLTRANQVYSETMSEWFTEYESLKNNR